jgi:peptidoglycan/xylan/chitin deacetylase (PgdA/CDA1 family)
VGLAATGISVPGAAYWWASQPRVYGLSPQVEVPIPAAGPLPAPRRYRSGVLVLCYHDLSPRPHNVYTVTPRAFAAQMAALHALGYHAVGLGRTVAYLAGRAGPLPPNAVLITFDDGAKGTWIYADSFLRRLHMRAAVMLITGDVSQHQPYYLDWAEVAAMQKSGRFEFGDHTRNGHGLIPAGGGREGPFLTEREWRPDEGRLETIDAYRARVAGDLDGSLADFAAHGLPRPDAFAYPFSAYRTPTNDPAVPGILNSILVARFLVRFDNTMSASRVVRGMRSPLPRVEVFHGMTAGDLIGAMNRAVRAPIARRSPTTDHGGVRS